ncbi:MAG: pseudouridine synthase [Bacilli bacterium]
MRIQKYLSICGVCSRREAERLIDERKIYVNGELVSKKGMEVTGNESIEVLGVNVKPTQKEYYLLNKPRGVISSSKDEKNRETVVDLVKSKTKVYPIGRLDYDTTGIILLTNDGELTNKLTHPSSNIEKEYLAKVKGFFDKKDAVALSNGIVLEGQKTKKASFKLHQYDRKTDTSYVKVILTEGRNHQVKDMFKKLNYDVLKLTRVRYAFLTTVGLKSGEYRKLDTKEVKTLYSLVK